MNAPRHEPDTDAVRDERHGAKVPDRRRGREAGYFEPPRRRREDMPQAIYWIRQAREWGWVLVLLSTVYVAIGFKTSGPAERLAAVETELRALHARRDSDATEFRAMMRHVVDSLTRAMAPTQKRTDALARYRCIHLDPETAYMLDLDCNALIPGYPAFKGKIGTDDESSSSSAPTTSAPRGRTALTPLSGLPVPPSRPWPTIPRVAAPFLPGAAPRLPHTEDGTP